MNLPIEPVFEPMEAESAEEIPVGPGWQYEPKWDGFRCLAFRDGGEVRLQSRNGRPLGRYFPDVVEAMQHLSADRFVLDGELVVPLGRSVSFEELQLRLHPAASRVAKLADAHPAAFVAFDLLVDEAGQLLTDRPLVERRAALERFAGRSLTGQQAVRLSPASRALADAKAWFRQTAGGLDGIVAKRLDQPYLSGQRAMRKVKNIRSADCVVGGFRYAGKGGTAGSLLLGLFNERGLLDHVGYTSSLSRDQLARITPKLQALRDSGREPAGFTGKAPGGPSRWSSQRSGKYEPLPHELVVEVSYDHVSGGRFRHGVALLRWRPDKSPSRCTMDQLQTSGQGAMALVEG